jgi:hypothetical protein
VAGALGSVYGEVGAREQLRGFVGRSVEREGDADARADADAQIVDVDRLAGRRHEPGADRARLGAVADALGDHEKLIAAQSRQKVAAARGLGQPQRDLLEDRVADRVPMGVVGALEVVKIDEQDRRVAGRCGHSAQAPARGARSPRLGCAAP